MPLNGHAVEARVYAEDPEHGFLPSTGRIIALELPAGEGIRVDTGVEDGSEVTPFYDPMIAKVIAHAQTRNAALDRLAGALDRTIMAGPRSNVAFLAALCRAETFRAGTFDTGFIERNLAALGAIPQFDPAAAALGALRLIDRDLARIAALRGGEPPSPWDATDGFQLAGARAGRNTHPGRRRARDSDLDAPGGRSCGQRRWRAGPATACWWRTGKRCTFCVRGRQTVVARQALAQRDMEHGNGDGVVRAPMHGKVLAILVEPGATVTKGQRLAIIEAMKMEHTLTAPIAGTISEISVAVGNQVAERSTIMVVRPANS